MQKKRKINKLSKGLDFSISRVSRNLHDALNESKSNCRKFVFITEGEGIIYIDSKKHFIQNSDIYVIEANQECKIESTSTQKGFLIHCNESFLDFSETNLFEALFRMSKFNRLNIKMSKTESSFLEKIYLEYKNDEEYSHEMIKAYVSLVFWMLVRRENEKQGMGASRKSIYSQFETLLITRCPELHKVQKYAELLNTTPQNLNAICRKHSNKSASEVITGRIMIEAKRHLMYTTENIENISLRLNFSEPSTFTKVFKKNVGVNPSKFRRENKSKKIS